MECQEKKLLSRYLFSSFQSSHPTKFCLLFQHYHLCHSITLIKKTLFQHLAISYEKQRLSKFWAFIIKAPNKYIVKYIQQSCTYFGWFWLKKPHLFDRILHNMTEGAWSSFRQLFLVLDSDYLRYFTHFLGFTTRVHVVNFIYYR